MNKVPRTWAEITSRFAVVLGGSPEGGGETYATVEELIQEACELRYGKPLHEVGRLSRQLTLQRMAGVLLLLEDEPADLAFGVAVRAAVREAFAKRWDGITLKGPPWRLDPSETDRPTYRAYMEYADF